MVELQLDVVGVDVGEHVARRAVVHREGVVVVGREVHRGGEAVGAVGHVEAVVTSATREVHIFDQDVLRELVEQEAVVGVVHVDAADPAVDHPAVEEEAVVAWLREVSGVLGLREAEREVLDPDLLQRRKRVQPGAPGLTRVETEGLLQGDDVPADGGDANGPREAERALPVTVASVVLFRVQVAAEAALVVVEQPQLHQLADAERVHIGHGQARVSARGLGDRGDRHTALGGLHPDQATVPAPLLGLAQDLLEGEREEQGGRVAPLPAQDHVASVDGQHLLEPPGARGHEDHAALLRHRGDGVAEGLGVVGFAVPDRSVVANIHHRVPGGRLLLPRAVAGIAEVGQATRRLPQLARFPPELGGAGERDRDEQGHRRTYCSTPSAQATASSSRSPSPH